MARYRILYWRDIPAQVKAFAEDGRAVSAPLSERWQQAIDRVAMRDGLAGSDEYLEQWAWSEDLKRAGSAQEVLTEVAAELEATWPGGT